MEELQPVVLYWREVSFEEGPCIFEERNAWAGHIRIFRRHNIADRLLDGENASSGSGET